MKKQRLIAVTLALTILFSVTACSTGGGAQKADTSPDIQVQTDVGGSSALYSEERLNISFDDSVLGEAAADPAGRSIFSYADGRVYYERYTDIRGSDGTVTGRRMEILSSGIDGGDERAVWSYETLYDITATADVFETIHAFAADGADNLWIIMQYETVDDSIAYYEEDSLFSYTLIKIGQKSETLASCDISSLSEKPVKVGRAIVFDDADNAYIEVSDGQNSIPWAFDCETAEPLASGDVEQAFYCMSRTRDGDIAYAAYRYNTRRPAFVTLRLEDTLKATDYDYNGDGSINCIYPGTGDWNMLFSDSFNNGNIYGYSLETGEERLIIDFVKSNITLASTSVGNVILPGGLVALSETEFLVSKAGEGLYKLTYDPDKTDDKVLLTIGVDANNLIISAAVQQFNRTSRTARIEIKDYSIEAGGDSTQAALYLDMDILTGKAPDIIYLSGLSPQKYISKGILADMTELLDMDTSVKREDLFNNILVLGEQNGKLYHIATHFYMYSFVGKKSIFGDNGITLGQIEAVRRQYPNAAVMTEYSALDWVSAGTSYMLEELIDWESAACNFQSDEFLEMLNFAKQLPSKVNYDWDTSEEDFNAYVFGYIERFAGDRVLLNNSLVLNHRSIRYLASCRRL